MAGKFYEQNKHVIIELGQSVRERWVNNSDHPGKEELILSLWYALHISI